MLNEIAIRNYALIENLRLQLDDGLNGFTGETGAGKSIIIDALGLLLGEKASASFVRKGSNECELTALFQIDKNEPAKNLLRSLSLQMDFDEPLIVRRQIDAQGKSKSFINDRPVNLGTLAELGEFLVDIHGQHDHQRLLKSTEQRELLDHHAGTECVEMRASAASAYAEWKNLLQMCEASQISEQEKNQKIDLYQFQVEEIDAAKLVPGEEMELEKILPQLKNAERLSKLAEEAYAGLYEAEGAALENLRKSRKQIQSILDLGVDLKETAGHLEESQVRMEEAVHQIQIFKERLAADPRQLDAVISRQDLIAKLKKKYGSTIEQILEYRQKIGEELERLQNHAQSLEGQERKIEQSFKTLIKLSKKLSDLRKKTSEKLSREVEKELKELGFLKARFSVELLTEKDEQGKEVPTAAGLERIEFLFSANPGEDLKPLKQVASGGELSRVMLALKKILAKADSVPTLIFDEIDAGIGGSMGHVVGEKLKSLSRSHQVLAITHLPQIAAYAGKHFAVRKEIAGGKTVTMTEALGKEMRIKEVARMLGGSPGNGKEPTGTSLKHAEELLESAKK